MALDTYKSASCQKTSAIGNTSQPGRQVVSSRKSIIKANKVDYDDILSTKPARIVFGVVLTIGGIFLLGKTLKIIGKTVEEARYFVKAIKGN